MKIMIISLLIISQVGCSSIIYSSGKHSAIIRGGEVIPVKREKVRQELGDPERIEIENGSECDVFIVEEMLPDDEMAADCFAANTACLPFYVIPEIYLFPKSIYDLKERIENAHLLKVYYSSDGYIIKTIVQRTDKHNQQVDPIVETPVDEVEAQSTQAHP